MNSRETMLQKIQQNQPDFVESPLIPRFQVNVTDLVKPFIQVLSGIGGQVRTVRNMDEVIRIIHDEYESAGRIVSFDTVFGSVATLLESGTLPHSYADVDVCLAMSPLAVAENGSVWLSDAQLPERVLPFIAQSLVAVVQEKDIVSTMHDAYERIADRDYNFATFIAGPSKTADIEQSLVLGAHGPKTMAVFVIQERD